MYALVGDRLWPGPAGPCPSASSSNHPRSRVVSARAQPPRQAGEHHEDERGNQGTILEKRHECLTNDHWYGNFSMTTNDSLYYHWYTLGYQW